MYDISLEIIERLMKLTPEEREDTLNEIIKFYEDWQGYHYECSTSD